MKAVLYTEPGPPEVLRYTDVADPVPGAADVVIAVEATSLNRLDIVQRNGWFQIPGFRYPHIAGLDVAGTVIDIGTEVEGVHIGQRVVVDPSLSAVSPASKLAGRGDLYGDLGVIGANADGGYAERCLAPASHCYAIPEHITSERAATFPTCWMTAWHALFEIGELEPAETVLVHAAASGVSVAAIQLAKSKGATVLATAGSADKLARAEALGADFVCNNRTTDVAAWARDRTGGAGVDLVLDHVGPALWEPSLFALRPRGRLVTVGNTTGDTASIPSLGYFFHLGLQIRGSDAYRYHEFAECWQHFCAHDFDAAIDAVYPLADAAAAQRRLEAGDVAGKLVLRP